MAAPLRAIGVFHAVARLASISKAAGELGVTPSAVSQQIQTLEVALGTTLIVKTGRRIKLTEVGERYFNAIAGSLEEVLEATERLRGYRAMTILTVRATPTFSTKWLLPRLANFIDAHPEIEVRIDGTSEPTDFSREDVDIEVRHGRGEWRGLFVEPVATESFLPVCAPSHAAAASLDPNALAQYRLIHSVKSQVQWPMWFSEAGVSAERGWRRLLFDRSHMAIDAAAAGMGIALEGTLMMGRELRDKTVICPVRAPPAIKRVTQWIVCPHDHLRHAKVRSFIDWLHVERDLWRRETDEAMRLLYPDSA